MSLVDHDSWEIEYEGCERLRHQILVQLNDRQQKRGETTTEEYVKLTCSIESSLEQLRKDVGHLKWVLDNAVTWETSSPEELQQRRINFDRLTSQLREIDAKFTSNTRANKLAARTASNWQDAGGDPPASSRPYDVESLKIRTAEILEHQNRDLEVLSATISRQRELATQVGIEVENQNTILDTMANSMDRVESGVHRETRNIGQVNRRDKTCGYWLVIIALFVAIIVVIFV